MTNKKNDWLATLMFQPEMTIKDLYDNGITPDNSKMESMDYYKELNQVKEVFTKDEKFNEEEFQKFYDGALALYDGYAQDMFQETILDSSLVDSFNQYGVYNIADDVTTTLNVDYNPGRIKWGITDLSLKSAPELSVREIAQSTKVFDSEKQEWLDWTPHDKAGLFFSVNNPTLALAAWDEDTIVDGVAYKKGQYKLNEDGDYYYETLGDREHYDKDILKWTDNISVEGTMFDKYNFLDSDDIEKSITGTVFKTAFTVAPLLIPGVGAWYGGITAGMEITKLLPTLSKAINGALTGGNNDFDKEMTKWENQFVKFNNSVSDYSAGKMFSAENVGNMIVSSSSQLFQQQAIGKIPMIINKLMGSPVKNDAAIKMSRNLAMSYMTATSAQNTYSDFKAAGANDRTAGMATIAMLGAYGTLFSQDYFKDVLFKNTYLDESVSRGSLKDLAKKVIPTLKENSDDVALNREQTASLRKMFTEFIKGAKKLGTDNKMVGGSFNEAVEETVEEISSDVIKGVSAGLNALGVKTTEENKELNFGFSAGDIMQRYMTSFVGGAIGGSVFHLHNKWQNKLNGVKELNDPDALHKITHLFSQGKGGDLRRELNSLYKKGKLGSVNLNGESYKYIEGLDGSKLISDSAKGKTQNDIVYEAMTTYLNNIENALEQNALNITESDVGKLFELQGLTRPLAAKMVIDNNIHSSIHSDLEDIKVGIIQTVNKLDQKITQGGTASTDSERQAIADSLKEDAEVKSLQEELKELRRRRDEILNGDKTAYYAGQTMFVLNEGLHSLFVDISKDKFTQTKYASDYHSLNDEMKRIVDREYQVYVNTDGKRNLFKAYDLYVGLSNSIKDKLININETVSNNTFVKSYDLNKLNELISVDRTSLSEDQLTELNTETQLELNNIINYYVDNNGVNITNHELGVINGLFKSLFTDNIDSALTSRGITDISNDLISVKNSDDLNDVINEGEIYDSKMNPISKEDLLGIFYFKYTDSNGNEQLIDKFAFEKNNTNTNVGLVLDLYSQFKQVINDQSTIDAIDVLIKEISNQQLKGVDEYTIGSELNKKELDDLKRITRMLNAVIEGAITEVNSGFNESANIYENNDVNKLVTINKNTYDVLSKELRIIDSTISNLLALNEINLQQKLRIHKTTSINMEPKLIAALTTLNIAGIDLNQIWNEVNNDEITLSNVDANNFKSFVDKSIEFESKVYEAFKGVDIDTIINSLPVLNSELSTEFTDKKDEVITMIDNIENFLSVISVDSKLFHNKYHSIISKDDFKYAPIPTQKHAVKIAYATTVNSNLFNKWIDKRISDKQGEIRYKTSNIVFVNAAAGAGKTSVIAPLLKAMLEDDSTFIAVSATELQAKKLANSIGVEEGNNELVLTINDLFNKITGSTEKVAMRNHDKTALVALDGNYSTSGTLRFTQELDNEKNKVLFIDESTLIYGATYELISKWASENNVHIIALGDPRQNSKAFTIGDVEGHSSFEDTVHIKTPYSSVSLRLDNDAQTHNANTMSSTLKIADDILQVDPMATDSSLSAVLEKEKVTLKYTNDNISGAFSNTGLKGCRITNQKQLIEDYIKEYIKSGQDGQLTIITDDLSNYSDYAGSRDKINIISPAQASQGGEWDYVIIDKNWANTNYSLLKDVYTNSLRARKASIIFMNNSTNLISSELDPAMTKDAVMSDNNINDFKKWALSIYDSNGTEYHEWKLEEQNEQQLDVDNSNTVNNNTNVDNSNTVNGNTNVDNNITDNNKSNTVEDSNLNTTNDKLDTIDDSDKSNKDTINETIGVEEETVIEEPLIKPLVEDQVIKEPIEIIKTYEEVNQIKTTPYKDSIKSLLDSSDISKSFYKDCLSLRRCILTAINSDIANPFNEYDSKSAYDFFNEFINNKDNVKFIVKDNKLYVIIGDDSVDFTKTLSNNAFYIDNVQHENGEVNIINIKGIKWTNGKRHSFRDFKEEFGLFTSDAFTVIRNSGNQTDEGVKRFIDTNSGKALYLVGSTPESVYLEESTYVDQESFEMLVNRIYDHSVDAQGVQITMTPQEVFESAEYLVNDKIIPTSDKVRVVSDGFRDKNKYNILYNVDNFTRFMLDSLEKSNLDLYDTVLERIASYLISRSYARNQNGDKNGLTLEYVNDNGETVVVKYDESNAAKSKYMITANIRNYFKSNNKSIKPGIFANYFLNFIINGNGTNNNYVELNKTDIGLLFDILNNSYKSYDGYTSGIYINIQGIQNRSQDTLSKFFKDEAQEVLEKYATTDLHVEEDMTFDLESVAKDNDIKLDATDADVNIFDDNDTENIDDTLLEGEKEVSLKTSTDEVVNQLNQDDLLSEFGDNNIAIDTNNNDEITWYLGFKDDKIVLENNSNIDLNKEQSFVNSLNSSSLNEDLKYKYALKLMGFESDLSVDETNKINEYLKTNSYLQYAVSELLVENIKNNKCINV